MRGLIPCVVSAPRCILLCGSGLGDRHTAPDLQQQKHQADSQQNVSDPRHAGDCRIRALGEIGPHDLGHPAYHQHDGGQVQPDMIDRQYPPRFRSGEGQILFQHQQQKEKHPMPSRK